MPRVSKRAAACRQAGDLGRETIAIKRRKFDLDTNSANTEDSGWQSDSPSDGMLTEEEDECPIGQPK
jgi:hypothetical protein